MEVIHKIGRRKTAVARVYVSEGEGKITINKKEFAQYFPTPTLQYKVQQPLTLTENVENFDIKVNVFGTLNLVKEIMSYQSHNKKKIRLIHISTDGVYPSTKGNYFENSKPKPYNVYGWTKLSSETLVKMLENYVVIRTRFFDKTKIRFNTAATDIFTSMIEVKDLVNEIKNISSTKFIGVINVGGRRKSDFVNYKKFKTNIMPCKRKDIVKNLGFKIAKDASMNLNLLKRLKGKSWKKSL